jgi:glycosyltransferase involved in cell wall biosynthesis
MIIHPTSAQLSLVDGITRSADFGRELKLSILTPPEPRFEGDTADARIRESLWPCGQAGLEYPPEMARPIQKQLAGASLAAPPAGAAPLTTPSVREKPAVAVITRTMDRPMFLERALNSVARQTYRDYVHVIVNDGGDNDIVKSTIQRANCDHARVRLVDAVKNRGMEAASNLAIKNSQSDYIIIHDDDDSWEPDFLKKTVDFLERPSGQLYGGVITRSTYVSEEVTPKGIVVHSRVGYNAWIENVHLMEMAIENFFPPIAFLFRRKMWEKLGGFNEAYPVLGDWDFNLRFIVEADIGVITEPLANYHHRDRGDVKTFGNSVIAGKSKHIEFASIVRNNFVRSLAQRGHAGAAALVGMGLHLSEQRNTLRAADQRISQIGSRMSAPSGTSWADYYWLAFQRLLTSVLENDSTLAGKLRGEALAQAEGMFARVKQAWPAKAGEPQRISAAVLDRAAADLIREVLNVRDTPMRNVLIAPDFDEAAYLKQNPDVEACVRSGDFATGYEHYLRYGRAERRPRPTR